MLVLPDDPSFFDRAAVFREHWQRGARFRIPYCCRAHFCLDSALGRIVSVVRWRQIGTWQTALHSTNPWVPCGFLHRGYSPHGAVGRAARILAFQAVVRLPGERSRWMRARMSSPGPAWTTVEPTVKGAISRAGGNGQLWWSRDTAGRASPAPPAGRWRAIGLAGARRSSKRQPAPWCRAVSCLGSESGDGRVEQIAGHPRDRRVSAGRQDLERRSPIESLHAAV